MYVCVACVCVWGGGGRDSTEGGDQHLADNKYGSLA